MKMRSVFGMLLLSLTSGAAFAGIVVRPISEPGILELLSMAAVAGVIVAIRKRRK